MILAYKDITRFLPIEVEGVVLEAVSRKPLAKVHVFTSRGEEETFTNEQGRFRFTCWQSLPLVVTVREPGGGEKQVRVGETPVKLIVLLP